MRNSGNFTRIRVGGSGSRVGRRDKLEWTTGNLNFTSSIVDHLTRTFPHFEPNNSGSTRASPTSVRLTWV